VAESSVALAKEDADTAFVDDCAQEFATAEPKRRRRPYGTMPPHSKGLRIIAMHR
jgi:hypothetical protein